MNVSYTKLQEYFATPLPPLEAVADAFTFHTWEIDGIEGETLDIKVLPNRASDAKTELGIARQLSAILNLPLKSEYEQVVLGTTTVRTSLAEINGTLGLSLSAAQVEDVFTRLRFGVAKEGDAYVITPPADRTDLTIPVDIAEEVVQIIGYDQVPEVELSAPATPADQARYRGIEKMKDQLVEAGFTEVSTQAFATHGDIELANPLDKSKPFLRTSLEENLAEALKKAKYYAPLLYGPGEKPKLFEVGSVFPAAGEYQELRMTEVASLPSGASAKEGEGVPTFDNLSVAKLEDYGKDYVPAKHELGAYKPFSAYPFIARDIAFWVPGTMDVDVGVLRQQLFAAQGAENILLKASLFDTYINEKTGRTSFAFSLVFQSPGKTLTDEEVNAVMMKISAALTEKGFEIR